MEGMSAGVEVVEYNLYHVIVFQDVRIRVDAVNGGVVGEFTGGESSVEGRDGGENVGYVVEERAAIASQLRHFWVEK